MKQFVPKLQIYLNIFSDTILIFVRRLTKRRKYHACVHLYHIKHGSVPRTVPGITVGHEMVGVVEKVGADVTAVKPGDRVTVNVETFCGECFFCRRGYVIIVPIPMAVGRWVVVSMGGRRSMSGFLMRIEA